MLRESRTEQRTGVRAVTWGATVASLAGLGLYFPMDSNAMLPGLLFSGFLAFAALLMRWPAVFGLLLAGLGYGEFTIAIAGRSPQVSHVYLLAVAAAATALGTGHQPSGRVPVNRRYLIAWVLYLVSIVPSVLLSSEPPISLLRYANILAAFLVWLTVSTNISAKTRDAVVISCVVWGGILALRFITQMVFVVGWSDAIDPAYRGTVNELPTFGRSNYVASFFVLLLPVAAGLSLSRIYPWARVVAFASGAMMLVALLLTFSRGGILASTIGLLLLAMLNIKSPRGWILVLAMAVAFLGVLNMAPIADAFGVRIRAGEGIRVAVAWQAIQQFRESWVIGTGLGSGVDMVGLGGSEIRMDAHNLVLGALQETGVIGAVGLGSLLLVNIRGMWRKFQMLRTRDRHAAMECGLLTGLVGALVHGLGEPNLRGAVFVVMFWALMAATLAEQRRRPPRERAGAV